MSLTYYYRVGLLLVLILSLTLLVGVGAVISGPAVGGEIGASEPGHVAKLKLAVV